MAPCGHRVPIVVVVGEGSGVDRATDGADELGTI